MIPNERKNSKFPSFKVKVKEDAPAPDLKQAFELVKKVTESDNIKEALESRGISSEYLAKMLWTCIEANDLRFDKHSNPIAGLNLKLRLQALKLAFHLRGDFKVQIQHTSTNASLSQAEALFDDIEVN